MKGLKTMIKYIAFILIAALIWFCVAACGKPGYEPVIRSRDWGETESQQLAQLAATLAGDQDIETKMLVMLVALNRVWSFPGNVEDQVKQMTETSELKEPDAECWKAEYQVHIDGWDKSKGALYLCRKDDANAVEIYDSKYQWLYDSGGYSFYK